MESDIIVIYKGNPFDSEIIKEILNDNGIIANLKNHLMGTIAPWQVSAGGVDPIEVEILANDKEQAMKLIDEYNSTNHEKS
ncbi:MAG: DUF2007 domain-containing protein [Bacteroidetes bacterium]|nr:DUF2007 domain-containing protein [Bacteroidota bacterium]MBT7041708.1 DUF2007 domain-containing protein [Bacteroidota bacterium]